MIKPTIFLQIPKHTDETCLSEACKERKLNSDRNLCLIKDRDFSVTLDNYKLA